MVLFWYIWANYKPIMAVLADDNRDIEKAIKQLQNPYDIIFEFMVLLKNDVGITASADNFFEDFLWDLEEFKYEVVRNAKQLINKGLTIDMVEDILYNAPYLMGLSEMEVDERLKKVFGENYINEMDNDTFLELLEKIAW